MLRVLNPPGRFSILQGPPTLHTQQQVHHQQKATLPREALLGRGGVDKERCFGQWTQPPSYQRGEGVLLWFAVEGEGYTLILAPLHKSRRGEEAPGD